MSSKSTNHFLLQERALKYVENLNTAREVSITDGISLIGNGSPRSARSFEPLADEPKARENQVEGRLLDAAADFLENHVIQLRVPKSTVEDVKRSLEEGQYPINYFSSIYDSISIPARRRTHKPDLCNA